MNIFKRDYDHMFWYIREYFWKRSFEKLNDTMVFEERPIPYLLAGICMFFVCIFFSVQFAFEYIAFGTGSCADYVGYMKYCYEKQNKGN